MWLASILNKYLYEARNVLYHQLVCIIFYNIPSIWCMVYGAWICAWIAAILSLLPPSPYQRTNRRCRRAAMLCLEKSVSSWIGSVRWICAALTRPPHAHRHSETFTLHRSPISAATNERASARVQIKKQTTTTRARWWRALAFQNTFYMYSCT